MPLADVTVPNRQSADARKQQIVQSVLDLVTERGAEAVTTQAIADAIGLTQPAVFRHFPTKEAIWLCVLEWLDDQLATIHCAADGDARTSPLDVLERMFLAHIHLIEGHPALAKLVFSDHLRLQYPSLNERFARIHEVYHRRLFELITRAKAEREVAVDLSLKHAAILYSCMVQGFGFQMAIAHLPIAAKRDARAVFALFRDAVAAR